MTVAIAAVFGVALLVGLAVGGFIWFRRLRGPDYQPLRLTDAATSAGIGGDGDLPALRADRASLIQVVIEVRDQVTSEALRAHMGQALAAAGVREVRPDGDLFDPTRHVAVDSVATPDARAHNRVAATERPGYVDHQRSIRLPEVLVYRHGA